ncbi:MAG: hypothetical protein JSS66_17910 [Armatimonadetes bacterium]|nr:hypothetical protein [Armatimonadota bacterium]
MRVQLRGRLDGNLIPRVSLYAGPSKTKMEEVAFLLDTGFNKRFAVTEDFVVRLGVRRGPVVTVLTASGAVDLDTCRIFVAIDGDASQEEALVSSDFLVGISCFEGSRLDMVLERQAEFVLA